MEECPKFWRNGRPRVSISGKKGTPPERRSGFGFGIKIYQCTCKKSKMNRLDKRIEAFIEKLKSKSTWDDFKSFLIEKGKNDALEHYMVWTVEKAAMEAGFFVREEVEKIDLLFCDANTYEEIAAVEVEQGSSEKVIGKLVDKLNERKAPYKILVFHPLKNKKRDPDWEETQWKELKKIPQGKLKGKWIFIRVKTEDKERGQSNFLQREFKDLKLFPVQ
ncbi:MAG: hypothetical protein QW356_09215 [Candidatus Hadarchaeales archaeon]